MCKFKIGKRTYSKSYSRWHHMTITKISIQNQLRIYINLYIKKQHDFSLRNDHLCPIYIFKPNRV